MITLSPQMKKIKKKIYKQQKEQKKREKAQACNTRMTRVWAMPLIPALLCASVLVYSCLIGQPAFIGDLSLKGGTVETLNNMTNRITGSLDVINLMNNRDTCDPVDYLVAKGFEIIISILKDGIIDELKIVLNKSQGCFWYCSRI